MFREGSTTVGVAVVAVCLLEVVFSHNNDWMIERELAHDHDWMGKEHHHDHDDWMSGREHSLIAPGRDKRAGQKMCGDKLIKSLMLICDYNYNKRGQDWTDPEEYRGRSVWRPRNHAVAMLSRVRRGVVDECCAKPCSIEELSSYCLASSAN